jgi:hypothetical protein
MQRPAPTFKATAMVDGSCKDISLFDYDGQWYVWHAHLTYFLA